MNTPIENLVFEPDIRRDAERLVLICGVHANLKGFARLTDAIILYSADDVEYCVLNKLYQAIADIRKIKPKTVIREISYAILHAPHIAARLSELVGATISPDEIHNGLVIAALATVLKAQRAAKAKKPDADAQQSNDDSQNPNNDVISPK